jgi:hypothetical protein
MRNPDSMKANANQQRVLTDDTYYVSAADLADKIIDRMQRGLGPLQLSNFTAAHPVAPMPGRQALSNLN